MEHIVAAVDSLRSHGVNVLSPADPRVVDQIGPFLFVASDRHRSVRLVQDRHLSAVDHSDFLWLVCPDGYVGQSASLEIGFAIARGVPVFGADLPVDLTLRQYVQKVDSIIDAIHMVQNQDAHRVVPNLLIDPFAAIHAAHGELEAVGRLLCPVTTLAHVDPYEEIVRRHRHIQQLIALPSR